MVKKNRCRNIKWTMDDLAYFFILSNKEFAKKFNISEGAAKKLKCVRLGITKKGGGSPRDWRSPYNVVEVSDFTY